MNNEPQHDITTSPTNTFYTLYEKRCEYDSSPYLDVCRPIRNERKQLFLYFILLASAITLTDMYTHPLAGHLPN